MKYRILIVEDDAINRQVLTMWLQRIGDFEIEEATNGEEALEMVEANLPDCILMDLKMPLLDGWEATRRIRASESHRHIPIIAVTAQALLGDEEIALAAGCDAYIAKPIPHYKHIAEKMLPLLAKGSK
jgi:CheY-like chemotaxis protein